MKKSVFFGILCILFANSVFAAPFTLLFSSTVTTNSALPTGVSLGDSFEIYVVVDNGGTSHLSQTWSYADIQSVAFSINGGSYNAGFAQATFIDSSTSGSIQTDGAGVVVTSTADWNADSTAGNLDTNGDELSEWYINGANDMIFYTASSDSIGAADSTDTANRWSVAGFSSVTAVPTMSVYGLMLTTIGLLLVAMRRFRPSVKRV